MNIKVRGKVWRLLFTRSLPLDADGLCDPPSEPEKAIRIRKGLKDQKELETVIHELLHAAFWDLDETAIQEAGEDICAVLWRLGYRRVPLRKKRTP